MKALVLVKNGKLEYGDVPDPKRPPASEGPHALVRVKFAGICGSDIPRAFENKAYHYPLIMGHEFSGIIEETGTSPRSWPEKINSGTTIDSADKGSKLKPGDRVTAFPLIPCRKCMYCKIGKYAQCLNYDYIGSRRDGAFAEYVYVPESNIFKISEHVELKHAALTEPCAVALHGVRRLNIRGGETAVVLGGGPIGNLVAQWLRVMGVERVLIVDIDPKKLEIARNMGFDTFNALEGETSEYVFSLTGGIGADLVVEACGLPSTYKTAIKSAATFGEVLFLGNLKGEVNLSEEEASRILRKEIKIYGSWNSDILPDGKSDWDTVLKYMDKKINVGKLISHTFKLREGIMAFEMIRDKNVFTNKVVLEV